MEVSEKEESGPVKEWMNKIKNMRMSRNEMNVLVMNYLEKEGFKLAAEKFQMESGISPTVPLDTLDKRILIRNHINSGRIVEAVKSINEMHPELLDNDNNLYFLIQQQQLIELIRNDEVEKALDFAQSHLAERAEDGDEVLNELEKTLALLAFDDPVSSPFGDLLSLDHRHKVASEVNAKILEQENQEPVPEITKILKLCVWGQQQLDAKRAKYVKMADFARGEFQNP